jgi:PPM family protein phosphatase
VGRVREKNEDSHLIEESKGLFVVADGMGGHVGGRVASSLAVESVSRFIVDRGDAITVDPTRGLENSPVTDLLADAVRSACATIYQKAQADPELQGMGTTVTAIMVVGSGGFVAHVGDSRCYLQRDDRIVQITDDHSLVNEQIKAGLITRDQARFSQLKNIITRSVGFEKDVAVDTFALPVREGDRFLLCSDGLANFVDDTEIGLALSTLELEQVPQKLIDLANSRGGEDNITVVCLALESDTN